MLPACHRHRSYVTLCEASFVAHSRRFPVLHPLVVDTLRLEFWKRCQIPGRLYSVYTVYTLQPVYAVSWALLRLLQFPQHSRLRARAVRSRAQEVAAGINDAATARARGSGRALYRGYIYVSCRCLSGFRRSVK